ncbi:hypothetical protein [Acidocella sp.]|uniref:hypothetical protein n=1 Tax=Acidocella sp. TaxID=50710 RepID=UPI0026189AE5|nr:hypothetical protein [Acidocella sp.]
MLRDNEITGQRSSAEQAIPGVPVAGGECPRRQNLEIEGQQSGVEEAILDAPSPRSRKRGVGKSGKVGHGGLAAQADPLLPALPDPNQAAEGHAARAEEAAPPPPSLLDASVAELMALQRQRRFAIKTQSRIDRSLEAYLAQCAGYRPLISETGEAVRDESGRRVEDKAGKKLWGQIGKIRRAVEAGNMDGLPAWADVSMISASAHSRQVWDEMRKAVEARMEAVAKTLPVWGWWNGIRGAGAKGLAIIVAECGDLGAYRDKSAVWKRLGLAVIDGGAQRRAAGDAALLHGFSPARRAEIWTIADSLFRAQWRGANEEEGRAAGPLGPYGAYYFRRRAHTEGREGWSAAHKNNDAKRYMTKALIRDLRAAWRRGAAGEGLD